MKSKKYNQLYKLLKTGKSHAGFTLIELLSGLIMSTIVIGGLGFGLFQLTKATRDESNKITARNETSRAMDFISDEVRRAQSIEVINTLTHFDTLKANDPPTLDPEKPAEDYSLPTNSTGGKPRLALQIPGVTQRVIYTVAKPTSNSPWQGPLVLYRWGPNLGNDGEYTDPLDTSQWDNEPLIDGLEDTSQSLPQDCVVNDSITITSYTGFFACMEDDDGDDIEEKENLLAGDTNGNLKIDPDEDELAGDTNGNEIIDDDDIDGLSITAQLYFSSGIDIANTNVDKKYGAETQVVARARVRDTDAEEESEGTPISFRTLGAEYSLHTKSNAASANPTTCDAKKSWTMRTDFINGNKIKKWKHDPDRQGQQISIDTSHNLQIASIPIGNGSCTSPPTAPEPISRGNPNETMGSEIYTNPGDGNPWTYDTSNVKLSEFTIDFDDPTTYNGTDTDNPDPGVDHVRIFKKGSELIYKKDGDVIPLDGYDDNPDTDDGEYSLGEFLAYKGYAVLDGSNYRLVNDSDDLTATNPFLSTDPNASPKLFKLKDTERIVAVEIGQVPVGPMFPGTTTYNPGFDLQDSVFILSVDKFAGEEDSH